MVVVKKTDSLTTSILVTAAALFILQSLIFVSIDLFLIDSKRTLAVYPVLLVYHCGILGGLIALKGYFRRKPDGAALDRVNFANLLTLFRLSSLPTLFSLILFSRSSPVRTPLLVLAVIVFLSDLVDGLYSRTAGFETEIGGFLDSSSDYLVLALLATVLALLELLPAWLFLLVLARGALMAVGMITVSVREGRIRGGTTMLGKIWVATLMVLFAAEILPLFDLPGWYSDTVLVWAEAVAGAVTLISLIDKCLYLKRRLEDVGTASH